MSFDEIIGKVIVESMVVAIGISVGTAQLGQQGDQENGSEGEEKDKEKGNLLQMMVLSLCGAVLISTSVAPTQEILQLAVESTSMHLS